MLPSQPGSSKTIPLFIRLDGRHIQVTAHLDWSIYQLKQQIYIHSNKSADDLRIIFAGCELGNHILLKNCQLSGGTIVHVINVSSNDCSKKKKYIPSTDVIAPTSSGIKVSSDQRRARFYIYCKSLCDAVKPGKLRVKCAQCSDEAFELSTGPNSWDDVLVSNSVKGKCNSEGCSVDSAKFYFRCGEHENVELDERESVIPLPLFRTNIQDVPCLACTDISDVVIVFPCPDSHVMCTQCFAMYCHTKLNSRQFVLKDTIGYTLPCPGLGDSCNATFIKEVHHFMVSGKEQYERYKNFATEEFVLQNGGILCPAENCGNGLLPESNARRVTCRVSSGGCGLVFCRLCHQAFHEEDSCNQNNNIRDIIMDNVYQVNQQNAMLARWRDEEDSKNTISKTTKPCPGCRVPTEKSGGCNHMSCMRCRHEWCWICLVTWGRNCEADHWFRAA